MKKSDPKTTCFVCNWDKIDHVDDGLHTFVSVAEAIREANKHDSRVRLSSTPEARYVEQYRPY